MYIDNAKAETVVTSHDEIEDYPGALAIYEKIKPTKGLAPIPSLLDIKHGFTIIL